MSRRGSATLSLAVLAALAYLPALTAAPGRMPTDSKLYLYLNPQRFVVDNLYTFDARQFAGWVPHQHISYLWPAGPWFSFFDWIGMPDWVAHRLWLGTILFAGGAGVRWAARHLGLAELGAVTAAVVYQLNPYVLPYVSRTSVMLLPWAGLGWIVGLTVLSARRGTWRYPALIALVVFTVGSVNATALAMIVPAPLLWLLHAGWARTVTWRQVGLAAARTTLLCAGVSLWWLAMLVIQSRSGADVLVYSETLEDVSLTSVSTEVMRGLGYWLFYIRDPFAATTTASIDYLASGRIIASGFLLVVVGLAGLTFVRWSERRFAALLVLAGMVLAVGVHPIDDPSPLMSLLGAEGSSVALALRSSTRALPVMVLGLALGAGALVSAMVSRRPRRGFAVPPAAVVSGAVMLLAVSHLPALWTGGFVDPALERDQDPPDAWVQAAAALDARPDGYRVLQVPGAEFGAFRWGYTVDQPLPALTERPLVTRDLLPLGSPAAMDLMYALDDTFQSGTFEPDALAPVARLFGADVVWLTNDLAWERFRNPRPDEVAAALGEGGAGLGAVQSFGPPQPNIPILDMYDERAFVLGPEPGPLPPVQLIEVEDPVPVIRAKDTSVVVSGSGEGLVDAGAARLISGHELLHYSASADLERLAALVSDAAFVLITDSHRDRARHWRSSQDVVGLTEDGAPGSVVLRPTSADQRLPVFDDVRADQHTVAIQQGPVTATATAYGEPFAYRPEHRPVMAVDGDVSTAWVVADRFEALGEQLRLDVTEPFDRLVLRQPDAADGDRRIESVTVAITGREPFTVLLDERSLVGVGQPVSIDPVTGPATITITVTGTVGERWQAVGFAEIDLGLPPTVEVIRHPVDVLDALEADTPLVLSLTRHRVRPTDRWRSDPEPSLVRQLVFAHPQNLSPTVTVRLNERATDDVIAALLTPSAPLPTADRRLTGVVGAAGWSAFDGDPATNWVSPFGGAVGSTLRFSLADEPALARLTLVQQVDQPTSRITRVRLSDATTSHDVVVPPPDPAGSSTIDVSALTPLRDEVTIEVLEIEAATRFDRRFAEPVELPVALVEVRADGLDVVDVPDTVDTGCRNDLLAIGGRPYPLRIQATVGELTSARGVTAVPCGDNSVQLDAGSHLLISTAGIHTGIDIDRVVLDNRPASPALAGSTGVDAEVTGGRRLSRDVAVGACPDGCWLVLGEGLNPGWSAGSLGAPVLVDGGFNGWELPPGSEPAAVRIHWTRQGLLTGALLLSLFTVLASMAIVGLALWRDRLDLDGPGRQRLAGPRWASWRPDSTRRTLVASTAIGATAAALLVSPWTALAVIAVGGIAIWRLQARWFGLSGMVLAGVVGSVVVLRTVRERFFPNAGWPGEFEDLHHLGMLVMVLVATGALLAPDAQDAPRARNTSSGPRKSSAT